MYRVKGKKCKKGEMGSKGGRTPRKIYIGRKPCGRRPGARRRALAIARGGKSGPTNPEKGEVGVRM